MPAYWGTGAAMCVLAVGGGFFLPRWAPGLGSGRVAVVGLGCAVVLWLTALSALIWHA